MKKIPDFTSPVFKKSSDLSVRISQIPPMDVAFQTLALSEYELLVATIHKLNELINMTNSYSELIDEILKWVVGDGVSIAVKELLLEWKDNGILGDLINDTLFQSKADKQDLIDLEMSLNQTIATLKADVTTDLETTKSEVNTSLNTALSTFNKGITDIRKDLKDVVTISANQYIEEMGGNVTLALQKTIDDALALNHAKVLWSGIYEINVPLVIDRTNTENITQIVFEGGGVIKKAVDFTGQRLLEIKKGWHDEDNIVFDNISFDGVDKRINGVDNFIASVRADNDGERIEDGQLSKFVSFNNCTFKNLYRGARLGSLQYNFHSCLFQNNIYGVYLNLAANNNTFVACSFRRNVVGAHLKQFGANYGTANNAFYNCIFESNTNTGLVNEGATVTALYGGYFENNGYAVDPTYLHPTPSAQIYFKGHGSAGNYTLSGIFFWNNASDYAISGDSIKNLYLSGCHNATINTSVMSGVLDQDISSVTATSNSYDSDIICYGDRYIISKGNKMKLNDYHKEYITQTKQAFKKVPFSMFTVPVVNFTTLKVNTGTDAIVKIQLFLKGTTSSGNMAHEGVIERSFYIARRTSGSLRKYNARGMGESIIGYANSESGAGGQTLDCLTSTSQLNLIKQGDNTFLLSVTNLTNDSLSGWGHSTELRSIAIVTYEGVHALGEREYPSEIIEIN